MSDGIISRQEEERLRAFRDNLALEDQTADPKDLGALDRASTNRIMMEARLAAISPRDGDQHLQDLSLAIRQAGLAGVKAKGLLLRAWEAAVEGALEDGLVSLDEELDLAKYTDHFNLTQKDLDQNGTPDQPGPGRSDPAGGNRKHRQHRYRPQLQTCPVRHKIGWPRATMLGHLERGYASEPSLQQERRARATAKSSCSLLSPAEA